ncbi:hypothetical protein SAMN05660464_2705 [Geodermatophilus dictyosporus]|uniref:Uncharacterized protein n=1 Tax=Geodermatophilus dictyosporus TaxID=1523247 RepID=A0A1I5P9M6_9ACTN|nr:hypothetical protein [Geodermatophilus dictyosporus]SFP30792.1 hypothetical protein SAMN05660464_2705 [Geodermatophilus dictyosporus]
MTAFPEQSADAWPSLDEVQRWQRALADVAARVRHERGIEEPYRLSVVADGL